jgi:hypothetical protein
MNRMDEETRGADIRPRWSVSILNLIEAQMPQWKRATEERRGRMGLVEGFYILKPF